jgi:tetratricopeptide (TPR) repeat protein
MLNRREAAEAAATTALDLGGERPNAEAEALAHRVLGRAKAGRGDWEGARRAFESELKARGDIPAGRGRDDYEMGTTLHALAEALMACGELDRAVANFRRALSYKDTAREWRSFAQTQTALRDALWQMGRKAEAIETGQHLIDLLNRQPSADLVWRGNAWAVQAQGHAETGRMTQRDGMLVAWQKCLADRIEEVLGEGSDAAPDQQGLRMLAVGLLLRSKPPLPTVAPDSTPDAASIAWLVALAGRALVDAEQSYPDTLAAWAARRDLGDVYMRVERWTEAVEVLAPLLTLPAAAQPTLPPIVRLAHLHTARAYIALEQPAAAAPSLEAALTFETDPQVRGAWLRELADSFRTAGNHARAVEYDGRALEYLRTAPSITSYTETMTALAYDQYRLERYPEAIHTFKEAIKLVESQRSPDRALLGTLLFDMGTAHAALGQHKEASATFKHALAFQDTRHTRAKYAETLIAMARSYLNSDSYGEALASYHEALQTDALSKPLRRAVLIEQAESFAKSRQPQAAVQAFKGALALVEGGEAGAEALTIHRGLAAAHTALGDHGAARAHFEAVLTAAEADDSGAELAAAAWQAVAEGHVLQGAKPEAINAFLKALAAWEAAPSLTDGGRVLTIQRALGELYYETGQPTAALRHLDLALTMEKADATQNAPRIARLLLMTADCHEQRSDPERAIHRYHEALVYLDAKTAPETVIQTLVALGRLYAGLRRWPDAIIASDEALALHLRGPSPDRARTEMLRRRLGDAYAETGKLEAAAEFYRHVAKAPTTSPERDAARESLRTVEAEIARHRQTLDAAEQSWTLFRKAARPELTELVFVRALQARTSAALGRDDDARRYTGMMLQLLKDRREDLLPNDPRPVVQALAAWLGAQEADERGDPSAAEQHRHAADAIERDPKANAALKWVLAQRGRIG